MHEKRGVKRKRADSFTDQDLTAKVTGKLHHDLKEVKKAAKKAKTFETQKLIRKLKELRTKAASSADVKDCEEQLEALRVLNADAVAHTAMESKLHKDKALRDNEVVQAAASKELDSGLLEPAPVHSQRAKVQGRVLSSKVLATTVASVIADLRACIGGTVRQSHDEDDAMENSGPLASFIEASRLPGEDDDKGNSGGEGLEDDSDADDPEDGWESGTVDDNEKANEAGWESGPIAVESQTTDEEDSVANPCPATTPKERHKPSVKPSKPNGESTFLPSLSVGFIRGSPGDSDWSDRDSDAADVTPKKNRRGQRARRAIWEKKYGRNANHKKKEAQAMAEKGRKRGTEANGKNTSRSKARYTTQTATPQRKLRPDSGWGAKGRDNGFHASQAPRINEQPTQQPVLHPSWEARRKLKEKETAAITPSVQSRKIKF